MVHVPLPVTGVLAANTKVDVLQSSWFGPASAVVGVALLVNVTSSKLEHDPFVIVQRRVTLCPGRSPFTWLVAEPGVTMVAPLAAPMIVHCPVPVIGVLPARLNVPLLQFSWSGPAVAIVGSALFVSVTSSKLEHEPFVTVQRKVTLAPAFSPVTVVVGELMFVITAPFAAPWMLQVPVPVTGELAAMTKVDVLQSSWFGPASAVVGVVLFVSVTSSKLVHDPFVMVHRRVTLCPASSPLTWLVADVGVTILAPLAGPTIVHWPVPVTGTLPARVNVPSLHFSWSGPAVAVVVSALFVRVTSSKLEQDPFVVVQRSVTLDPALSPVTVVVGELAWVITAPFAAP